MTLLGKRVLVVGLGESGLAMARDPAFGETVYTAGLSPLQVASTIAARIRA